MRGQDRSGLSALRIARSDRRCMLRRLLSSFAVGALGATAPRLVPRATGAAAADADARRRRRARRSQTMCGGCATIRSSRRSFRTRSTAISSRCSTNRCLTCHARQFIEGSGAPMISVTHFMDREARCSRT